MTTPTLTPAARLRLIADVIEAHDLDCGSVYVGAGRCEMQVKGSELPVAAVNCTVAEWAITQDKTRTFRFHTGYIGSVKVEAIERGPRSNVADEVSDV
jgi:hypothetical protein